MDGATYSDCEPFTACAGSFDHNGHISMTFELLGESIWGMVCRQGGGCHISRVRDIAAQILSALAFSHDREIIHADVKSENVLIASHPDAPGPLYVKLVDFGCAIYSSSWHPPIAGTMNYRAPESVIQVRVRPAALALPGVSS